MIRFIKRGPCRGLSKNQSGAPWISAQTWLTSRGPLNQKEKANEKSSDRFVRRRTVFRLQHQPTREQCAEANKAPLLSVMELS